MDMLLDPPPPGPYTNRLFELIAADPVRRYRATVDPRAFVTDLVDHPSREELAGTMRPMSGLRRIGMFTPTTLGRLLQFAHDRAAFDAAVAANGGRISYRVARGITSRTRRLLDADRRALLAGEDVPSRAVGMGKLALGDVWALLGCFAFAYPELEYLLGVVSLNTALRRPEPRAARPEDAEAVCRIGVRHLTRSNQTEPDVLRERWGRTAVEACWVIADPLTGMLHGYVRWIALTQGAVDRIERGEVEGISPITDAREVATIRFADGLQVGADARALYIVMAVGESNLGRRLVIEHIARVAAGWTVYTRPSTQAGLDAVRRNEFVPVGTDRDTVVFWRRAPDR